MDGDLVLGDVVEMTCYWTKNSDSKTVIFEKERTGFPKEGVFFSINGNDVTQINTTLFPEFSAKVVFVPQGTYRSSLIIQLLGATKEDVGSWHAIVEVSGVEHKSPSEEMTVNGWYYTFQWSPV